MDDTQKPSILKQITGAIVGGTIALVAYYAYDFGAPKVTAWLITPGYQAELGHNTIADKDTDATDSRRIQAQARHIAADANRTVPEYSQYTAPVASSSAASTTQVADSIWEQAWQSSSSTAMIAQVPDPVEPEPMYEPPVPTEPVQSAHGEPVPQLPDSGFGLWALVGTAGAAAGSQYRRLRKRK